MSATVETYMNRELVYLRAGDRVELARRPMIDLGIHTVPVLDDEHKPIATVSLRDLADDRAPPPRTPGAVKTLPVTATIDEAAKFLVEANLHQVVIVDRSGVAVGMLSVLDVLRAIRGDSPRHPEAIQRVPLSQAQLRAVRDGVSGG